MRITSDNFIKDFARTGMIELMINNTIANTLVTVADRIITTAKAEGNYKNQTGNLRNAFGYIILKGDKVIYSVFPNYDELKDMRNINYRLPDMAPEEYLAQATENIVSRLDTSGDKWQLVVFSGAYYALFVELKGYNVLTDFVLDGKEVEEMFRKESYTNMTVKTDISKSFQYQNIIGQTVEYRFNGGNIERRIL